MVSVNNISFHFTGDFLFENVSFVVNEKDRIGLIGKNGTGKSTLLKILSGQLEPETGVITTPSYYKIGYLPQEMIPDSSKTVLDETLTAFSEVIALEKEINRLNDEIIHRTDYESVGYHNLIDKFNELNEQFVIHSGQSRQEEAEKVLLGLGFTHANFSEPMTNFSSGWQMRVELAKILLRKPDLILLDEPTNHLDIEAIQWLEEFLSTYFGALILISHDRAFLDNVTKRTLEISLGQVQDYKASYSDYVLMREERRQTQLSAYNNQQKEIADIESFIERFRYKATKSKQVQSRVKMLEKMDMVAVDEKDNSAIHFRFPPAPHSGKVVVEINHLFKSYDTKLVLKDIDLLITKGERIAFVGRNGEGKSTLSKIIVGELAHEGECKLGHQVSIGYFGQNQATLLDGEKTVFETVDSIAVGEIRTKLRNILGSFLFGREDIDKKVKVLSGGEKARLALAKLLLSPVNLLVLDEPTNHLDMISKDILKNALLQFEGTMIIVSHDRDFLQGLTEKVFEFKNQKIREFVGDIYDFLESRKLENLSQLEIQKKKEESVAKTESITNKENYERNKEIERELRKIKTQIEKCETSITSFESQIAACDKALADPEKAAELMNKPDFYKKYEELKSQLERTLTEWEDLHSLFEEKEKEKS